MGRQFLEQIRPRVTAAKQHLLLLLALELLVVELRGAALVRGEIAGHDGKTRALPQAFPGQKADKLKGRRAWRDDPPNMVSGWMLQPGRPLEG